MLECWVFDLDGTLVDTRDLIAKAYRAVGIEMPPDAWGRPARDWIPDDFVAVQRRKNEVYTEMLRSPGCRDHIELPASSLARSLVGQGYPCGVLTGASLRATRLVLEVLDLPLEVVGTGQDTAGKIDRLIRHKVRYPVGTYVDDQDGVTVPDGWRFLKWTR